MKPEELFIGAWVYNAHHNKNIQITPYDFFTHRHDENGVQHLQHNSIPRSGMDLHPIPLTPEILKKNGFEHRGRYYLIFDDPSLALKSELQGNRLIFFIGHLFDCYNFHAFIELQFVHELQAAMRLCGIEKEIVL